MTLLPQRGILFALGIAGLATGLIACVTSPTPNASPEQPETWPTYVSEDAAFSFEYPPDALITTSEDASLAYKIVYVQFPVTETQTYQGASIMVIENADDRDLRAFVTARYAAAGHEAPPQTQRAPAFQVNGRAAIRLERDEVVGSLDKYTVLIAGDGVIYRVNLFGGGVGGPVEPPPAAEAMFERLVQSFRVLDAPLKPRSFRSPDSIVPLTEPPAATVFTYPMRSAAGVNYGVPTGIVIGGVRMEWLDYGVRNLDQWRIKCYGVDWSRMLHAGEDWYREDYLTANTAGAPVYAVADGVVARHDPGINYPGNVVLIRHRLPDGRDIYSMYGHVANVRVTQGQVVSRGQQIATVFNQRYVGRTPNRHPAWDSHLHFEMRWIGDAGNIYTPGTNAYNYNYPACNYLYPGRGYTYLIHPDDYPYPGSGYVDPSDFIAARLEAPPDGCAPTEIIVNGSFERGVPGTPWTATNSRDRNDPLIYRSRPRTGRWGGWLGAQLNYRDTLAQVVSVPAGAAAATLTFWYQVRSAEPRGNGDDRMIVALTAPDGQPVGAPLLITSAALRNVWVREVLSFDLSSYAHPTVTLSFTGDNDGKNRSSFFLDDISLVSACVSPTASASQRMGGEASLLSPATTGSRAPRTICANRLVNGGFEDANSEAWTGVANTATTIYNVIPNGSNSGVADPLIYTTRPRTGARSGRVGSPSINGYWNEMLQAVPLPDNVASVTLTFWRYLDTGETSTTAANDVFRIGLETARGIEIVAPLQIDNRSAGRGRWVQETLSLPNAYRYAGQTLWVSFKGRLNGSLPTALYIDDVALNVCAAP